MKKSSQIFIFLIVAFFISDNAFSQEYLLMIDEGTHKVEEVQQSAETFFQDKSKGKGSGYKQYKRWEYMALRMMNEDGYLRSSGHYIQELEQFNVQLNTNSNTRALLNDNWEELGPLNWNATSGWNPGVGRITAFSIDETNENHIIVGGETGGVWKTIDGGQNWQPLSDYFSNLSVYSTAIMPGNPNTYFFGSTNGRIYKSTDGGATWSQIGAAGNSLINKIVIHPTNTNIIFASSENSGVYRSTNGGSTWTSVISDSRGYDIEFKPGDLNTVYASGILFHKSTDGGATFSVISGFDNTGAKMIGISEDDQETVYVLEAMNSKFGAFYVSTNSGATFTKLNHGTNNYFGYSLTASDDSGQAPRDMDIAVNPNNVSEVHVAGVQTWYSNNGGVSFEPTSHWIPGTAASNNIGYNHADVDIMAFYGNTLYTATDGGIFKATNTTNVNSSYYTDITEGLGIRQFYKFGVSQTDPAVISGGSQDNGTSFYTDSQGWQDWLGADGMETFIDKDNSSIMYGTTQFGQLYKTIDAGLNYTGIDEPVPGEGDWVTPFEQDPQASNTIYLGYNKVFKSTNGGDSWIAISQDLGDNIHNLKISESNPDIMFASRENKLYKNSQGGGFWLLVSNFNGWVNSIAIHPTNPDKIAVSLTGSEKVMVSVDGGQTWQSYLKNLPDFAALALVWQDNSEDGLYLGMNYGVYYIDNSFANWQVFNNNLPNVIVNELEINYAEDKIYAATYGRGLWASDVYDGVLANDALTMFNDLSVYPNPAENSLYLKWDKNHLSQIRIFDASGKLLYFKNEVTMKNTHEIDISDLTAGIYYVRINNENGVTTKKVIIK
ncbi:MAG: T9SS type A sorting domain-containing protein [Flavobacteriaceae bacterium]